MLKDRSNVEEIFEGIRKDYENKIQQYKIASQNTKLSQISMKDASFVEMILTESSKTMDFLEMVFLNNAFTYNQLRELTEIVSKMHIESTEIKKRIQELQNQNKENEKSIKKGKGLLKKFHYELSSFDVNAGLFKGHFEHKKE